MSPSRQSEKEAIILAGGLPVAHIYPPDPSGPHQHPLPVSLGFTNPP